MQKLSLESEYELPGGRFMLSAAFGMLLKRSCAQKLLGGKFRVSPYEANRARSKKMGADIFQGSKSAD